ncbi:hypothetical protein E1A91_A07G020100v1 [Gossypium mustelinum]|uniref:F-box/LRR-repeat protein 15-like leucin rich repeat domain-containing protein n=1 Tax=Gossypium mustelinum TaxID=34275 RepID=A0A5D2YG74_GOSMU|nr:hypothetical protein E1A91_A07G020100v1 [Gossypium mustelinum]
MGDVGFFEKTDSRENEGNLEESEGKNKERNEHEEEEAAVFYRQQQHQHATFLGLDLNLQPPEEIDFGNEFWGFDFGFPEKQTENFTESQSVVLGVDLERKERSPSVEIVSPSSIKTKRSPNVVFDIGFPEKETENFTNSGSVVFGVDLKGKERCPDVEIVSCSSKKRKFSVQEKGKAKLDGFGIELDEKEILHDLMQIDPEKWVSILDSPVEEEKPNYIEFQGLTRDNTVNHERADLLEDFQELLKKEKSKRQHEIAKDFAQRLAREVDSEGDLLKSSSTKDDASKSVIVDDDDKEELGTPFSIAMEVIKTRISSSTSRRKKLSSEGLGAEFKWVPKNVKRTSFMAREVPSLLDLSLCALAKNAEAIVSLNHVPDMLRHKLSRSVSNSRKMDAHFLQLLASGSPTEIRVNDCSRVTEDEFTKIFGCCDTKNLIVLQLDLCGSCIPDYVLQDTLAHSSKSLPALVTLSLNGAYRLTDQGLNALALSAPALQSINLSQCSLLTSSGINDLANCFESTLRELYFDECHNIEAMVVLPALKKLKCLEVLSMAGIQTVCDDFVIKMVEACGKNMKELVFASCVELTDVSLKFVGKNCSKLCAIDLSYLRKLTDLSMRYLANGCRSINRLKLCRNGFSDEAIAAFFEASGSSLTELSLNNIASVGLNTAISLSKCSRKLFSLDLSWCRNLTDEALGLVVDSCSSLKLLKLFGCTQITDVFLKGHSNPQVQIIGLKMATLSEFLNVFEPREAPLRYSPVDNLH